MYEEEAPDRRAQVKAQYWGNPKVSLRVAHVPYILRYLKVEGSWNYLP